MSSFFSALSQITVSSDGRNNPHADPTPAHIETVRSIYGSSLRARLDEVMHAEMDEDQRTQIESTLTQMMESISDLPDELEGAPQSYVDALERVPTKYLKKGMTCPICAVDFLDDEYPLVVRLPCHKDHLFDLECIGPWLLMKATCPLDRKKLLEKKKEVPKPVEEEEEDYDEDCL